MKAFRAVTLTVCILCLLSAPLCVQAESTVIAAFSYDNTGAIAEGGLKDNGFGDKDTGYLATEGEGLLFASVNGIDARKLEWSKDDYDGLGMQAVVTGGNKNPWGEGAYLEVRVSTAEMENITFTAKLGGTKKGPRDYKLQYSVDGVQYTDVGATYTIMDNKTLEPAFTDVALPAEAAGRETLYIRMTVISDTTIGGASGLIGSTGGETAISGVVVSGTPSPGYIVDTSDKADSTGVDGRVLLWGGVALAVLIVAALVVVIVVVAVRKKKA